MTQRVLLAIFAMGSFSVVAQPASVTIMGGSQSLTITASDLAAMPRTSVTATAHNATGAWDGVSMRELLTRAGVPTGKAFVVQLWRPRGNWRTNQATAKHQRENTP